MITILPLPLNVTISTSSPSLIPGEVSRLTITVTDGSNPARANLTLSSSSGGELSSPVEQVLGVYVSNYTAPLVTSPGVATIQVTAMAVGFLNGSSQTTIDLNPYPSPSWPSGTILVISDLGATDLTLSWPAASDNLAVTSYQIYNGPTLIAIVQGNVYSYRVTGLSPGATYTFTVKAEDSTGNQSSTGLSSTETLPARQPSQQYSYVFLVALVGALVLGGLTFNLLRRRKG